MAVAQCESVRNDLKVSIEELMLRGPGVVLDHTRANGMRVLLWSEAVEAP